jgi:hypothetical protein
MSKTLLTHKKCGGNVIAELKGFRLITPFLGFSFGKLSVARWEFLDPNLKIPTSEENRNLYFLCTNCGELNEEELEHDVISSCSICCDDFPVADLIVTDYAPEICKNCLAKIKTSDDDEILKIINMPAKARKRPLIEVLTMPVKI